MIVAPASASIKLASGPGRRVLKSRTRRLARGGMFVPAYGLLLDGDNCLGFLGTAAIGAASDINFANGSG